MHLEMASSSEIRRKKDLAWFIRLERPVTRCGIADDTDDSLAVPPWSRVPVFDVDAFIANEAISSRARELCSQMSARLLATKHERKVNACFH